MTWDGGRGEPVRVDAPQPVLVVVGVPRPVVVPVGVPRPVVPVAGVPRPLVSPVRASRPVVPVVGVPRPVVVPVRASRPVVPVVGVPRPVVVPVRASRPVVPVAGAPRPLVSPVRASRPVVPGVGAPRPVEVSRVPRPGVVVAGRCSVRGAGGRFGAAAGRSGGGAFVFFSFFSCAHNAIGTASRIMTKYFLRALLVALLKFIATSWSLAPNCRRSGAPLT